MVSNPALFLQKNLESSKENLINISLVGSVSFKALERRMEALNGVYMCQIRSLN